MKIKNPFLIKLGGLLGCAGVQALMRTLDYRVVYYDRAADPAFPECQGHKIYLFWHEYILFPLDRRRRCNLAMLLSQHRDADILSQAARHLGFGMVRGSTRRGGVAALRELVRKSRRMHLAITPDGPRGPRRHVAPGAIYLASKLGLPLVPIGFGYDRPWRMPTWDRFAVPRPFSRARVVMGPEVHVPEKLNRAGRERFRAAVERLMRWLTDEAESWAESGGRRKGEMDIRRGPQRLPAKNLDRFAALADPPSDFPSQLPHHRDAA